ncbi:tRNA (N6-isopentenyl adenosine(37)-C2)-methylthiotransferase MiaB [Eisenibacter elegans]|jgi:tRNA-2-methylthio-N6-dimethylallyladenosine synthase|uniref:tRNA (N6-isopentenyl adenosine(37)-C2)-methylthiotransferase MiaB n=1 Tax=Eisenibacter elegans TaxID=997 RepID=UPI00047DA0A6|nr:tRNA (N6-isopentenyl adenosine(37)-C2)-methylthiotransferase MiaB [Eisenibacter elegans]
MSKLIQDIPVMPEGAASSPEACETYQTTPDTHSGKGRKLYIESYGCQMNFSDSEIVASVMSEHGFDTTSTPDEADVIFLNTCAIRDNAEQRIRKRLQVLNDFKQKRPQLTIGVLGCMAERLKAQLLEEEKMVDLVAGPDAYRALPDLVAEVDGGHKAVNVFLSREETYADITPVRLNSNGITAFISISRGCDNMCSFCVVPFTRGRERSRNPHSIVAEAQDLFDRGYREVTLLGQNVDSYLWSSHPEVISIKGEEKAVKKGVDLTGVEVVNFAQLLESVAKVSPDLRVRFSTSHPKDMTDDVLRTMAAYDNICNYIHLPVQSGSSRVLDLMNRGYTREWYMDRVEAIRRIVGNDCGISTDIITGFCTETEEDHQATLSLMEWANYDFAYMFYYSERPNTPAAKKHVDDVPLDIKKRRLNEVIALQQTLSARRNQQDVGRVYKVLIEGFSKRSDEYLMGRNSANKVVVFPKEHYQKGQYAHVLIKDCTAATLLGEAVE